MSVSTSTAAAAAPFTYLIEIGSEELPPSSLKPLSASLFASIKTALTERSLEMSESAVYSTPRRLACQFQLASNALPRSTKKVWGPPAKIAFQENGEPGKAAIAFAQKNGVDIGAIAVENDGKQDKLAVTVEEGGEAVLSLLPALVSEALDALPIPKRMRWGSARTEFLRPLKWISILENDQVASGEVYGLPIGRNTCGHRFYAPEPFPIDHANDYADSLKSEGHTVASFTDRRDTIRQQVTALPGEQKLRAVIDEDLLDEVTALVEWPKALLGRFDESFLEVPQEALILSMKEHQKYFHVVDDVGRLAPFFIFVANLESKDESAVIAGNERVIRPRLADARFFFDEDRKHSLESRFEKLKKLTFQAKLGSVADKAERLGHLAKSISKACGFDLADELIEQSARLAKCDLVSLMVYEFPEMQGTAGKYYAQAEGLAPAAASAIEEHYLPRDATDELPTSELATALALGDRLDTLCGIFAIGLRPSGSKDPFALRRASIAILRLILEKQLALDLSLAVDHCLEIYQAQNASLQIKAEIKQDILNYLFDRFAGIVADRGYAAQLAESVRGLEHYQPADLLQRVEAVSAFAELEEAEALAQANKRVANILQKSGGSLTAGATINPDLFAEDEETTLYQAIKESGKALNPLMEKRDYRAALTHLAELKTPIDAFFDKVMVMADDPALQQNRLLLLRELRGLFSGIADISVLSNL